MALLDQAAHAQLSLTGTTYTQNFDGLANTGNPAFTNNSTIPGFYAYQSVGATTPTDYVANSGGSGTGSLYSFGAASATDRAFGSVASGTPGNYLYALVLTNNTGSILTGFTLSYTGEQWRNGGNVTPQNLTFSYLIDITASPFSNATLSATLGYVPVAGLTFTSPTVGATAGALDGNAAANRTALSSTITAAIPVGATIYLRFTDLNDAGNDHGLAVDDLSLTVTPVPEPTTWLTGALLVGAFGWHQRRRLQGLLRA